jgi:hypothetical protein
MIVGLGLWVVQNLEVRNLDWPETYMVFNKTNDTLLLKAFPCY